MSILDGRLEADITTLGDLGLPALRARWRSVTGRVAPAQLPKGLLTKMLAYRLQADATGDLDPATARFLDRLASEASLRRSADVPLPDRERLGQSAMLIREWKGVSHRVATTSDGFAWNGATYRSLSEVARAITGARWNGPRFFGLRGKAPAP